MLYTGVMQAHLVHASTTELDKLAYIFRQTYASIRIIEQMVSAINQPIKMGLILHLHD